MCVCVCACSSGRGACSSGRGACSSSRGTCSNCRGSRGEVRQHKVRYDEVRRNVLGVPTGRRLRPTEDGLGVALRGHGALGALRVAAVTFADRVVDARPKTLVIAIVPFFRGPGI